MEVEVNERGWTHAAVSNAVVRVTAEYTGRGPTRVRTVVDGDWIFVTLADTLTKGERQLAHSGRRDFVRQMRKAYQDAMCNDLVAEIQRITGRPVDVFLSDNHVDPDVAVEAFRLRPAVVAVQPHDG